VSTICRKCGRRTDTPGAKYCGWGDDKDNHHDYATEETLTPEQLARALAARKRLDDAFAESMARHNAADERLRVEGEERTVAQIVAWLRADEQNALGGGSGQRGGAGFADAIERGEWRGAK
jgi:hypothetical protein